jgi:hypothetical protein
MKKILLIMASLALVMSISTSSFAEETSTTTQPTHPPVSQTFTEPVCC